MLSNIFLASRGSRQGRVQILRTHHLKFIRLHLGWWRKFNVNVEKKRMLSCVFFFIKCIGVTVNKICRFKCTILWSMICMLLCVYHPKSNFFSTPLLNHIFDSLYPVLPPHPLSSGKHHTVIYEFWFHIPHMSEVICGSWLFLFFTFIIDKLRALLFFLFFFFLTQQEKHKILIFLTSRIHLTTLNIILRKSILGKYFLR